MTLAQRIVSMWLRSTELIFAAIVAGVTGDYLHRSRDQTDRELGRFIYTETLAAISILCAILWLLPFASHFRHWPLDLVMSLCWFASFGLVVDFMSPDCGRAFDWNNVSLRGDQCGKFKADVAFSFLSALLWLLSALIGFAWVKQHERTVRRAEAAHAERNLDIRVLRNEDEENVPGGSLPVEEDVAGGDAADELKEPGGGLVHESASLEEGRRQATFPGPLTSHPVLVPFEKELKVLPGDAMPAGSVQVLQSDGRAIAEEGGHLKALELERIQVADFAVTRAMPLAQDVSATQDEHISPVDETQGCNRQINA